MDRVIGLKKNPNHGGLLKDHWRASVAYIVPFEDMDEFIRAVRPFCRFIEKRKFVSGREAMTRKMVENRRKFIVHNLSEDEVSIGSMHKSLRQKGYSYCFKTFQRDIVELGVLGLVDVRKTNGGKFGNTTFVKLRNKACSKEAREQAEVR